ncbi:MAG: 2-amino-4-hydroxy-6-hydroxymethyldihydropteridine diphosphokinase [Prevotellaceae bacterium]|jgi:2-amino-4-hydroxy-6-hydroxymethyldihydropteridine diphosphokinase|nr:2-amino-4-hydroxy-6-hydroxymethyldihydropteridine diphosphokinase [Prevotellaceae bacterium]
MDTYLLLGSNKGERVNILDRTRQMIEERIGMIIRQSSLYESEAWGFVSDNFINQVICTKTELPPQKILSEIHKIEADMGRKHTNSQGYQARTLDIDILFYDSAIINQEDLIIPHSRLHERYFTLLPLNEIAPELKHPVLELTIQQLLEKCIDTAKVWNIR